MTGGGVLADFEVGGRRIGCGEFFVIAGPCVIENEALTLRIARFLRETCAELNIPCIFKSSYDKANRTSIHSFRGPGIAEGLAILAGVREETGLPVITDIHSEAEAERAGAVVDVLQVPAFLCRQTDILAAAAATGRPVSVKKGQVLAPRDIFPGVDKLRALGCGKILLTERGSQFGYNNLVVDMRSIPIMRKTGCPVVFDATHSVQLPGGQGTSSGGERRFVETLACAATAAGASGVFLEIHEDPDRALCDGPNSLPLDALPPLLQKLKALYLLMREGSGS